MGSYISSNANRFYTGLESAYGHVPQITGQNRIPAVALSVRQELEKRERKDKTGTRTFPGLPAGGRRRTSFELKTYLTNWDGQAGDPGYGPLVQGCLGGAPLKFASGTAGAGSTGGRLVFQMGHGLTTGQAVSSNGEIRFVTAVVNPTTVQLNAPFSVMQAGTALSSTISYVPGTDLPSVSVFDYWSPATAVQRLLCGAAVNQMAVQLNSDFHELQFSGLAQDVVDNASFSGGIGQLDSFPPEPQLDAFDYTIVPGNLGQAWLGTSPDRFLTITAATIQIDNGLDLRAREFGSSVPLGIAPGTRNVSVSFTLFQRDEDATKALYQAARQQSPVSVMFQLGEQKRPGVGGVSAERGSGSTAVRRWGLVAAMEISGIAGAGHGRRRSGCGVRLESRHGIRKHVDGPSEVGSGSAAASESNVV